MEINDHPETIAQYWSRYWRRSVFLVVCIQLIAVLVIGAAMLLLDIFSPENPAFWIMMVAVITSVVGLNILLLSILAEPLKQLTAALAHANGEHSSIAPPNPNIQRYRTNGISPLLKFIYAFGSQGHDTQEPSPAAAQSVQADFAAAFGQNAAGLVLLDSNKKVLYRNAAAPISDHEDGSFENNLLFYTEQTLDEWLANCEKGKIRATKTWKQLADKPPGEPDRRVFDLVATYQKGSAVPVVLLCIDKTGEYAPEDDALSFVSFAAHELRGPITVIRGYLDTLLDEMDGRLENDQRELFDRLIVSANRLSSYINNILNTAKYDRRHLNVHMIETSVKDVYDMVADDMQLRARTQHRLLSVDLPDALPTIAADPASLGEVFANLIDNAIKYSNEGGAVEVSAELHGTSVEVQVTDHGIGMPANVVGNLFHKFYRSHRSRETVAGTGIGLYISKAIMESHGGSLSARSVEGHGSTFTFSIPTYASVAKSLEQAGGTNQNIIRSGSGSWIKNHGAIKG